MPVPENVECHRKRNIMDGVLRHATNLPLRQTLAFLWASASCHLLLSLST